MRSMRAGRGSAEAQLKDNPPQDPDLNKGSDSLSYLYCFDLTLLKLWYIFPIDCARLTHALLPCISHVCLKTSSACFWMLYLMCSGF